MKKILISIILFTILIGSVSAIPKIHPTDDGWKFKEGAKVYENSERIKNYSYQEGEFSFYERFVIERTGQVWLMSNEFMDLMIHCYYYNCS